MIAIYFFKRRTLSKSCPNHPPCRLHFFLELCSIPEQLHRYCYIHLHKLSMPYAVTQCWPFHLLPPPPPHSLLLLTFHFQMGAGGGWCFKKKDSIPRDSSIRIWHITIQSNGGLFPPPFAVDLIISSPPAGYWKSVSMPAVKRAAHLKKKKRSGGWSILRKGQIL